MRPWWFPKAHFTTWDDIDKDSWFLVESTDAIWFDPKDDGDPFDTLDANWTVYYGSVKDN